jgi:hypothetical protein
MPCPFAQKLESEQPVIRLESGIVLRGSYEDHLGDILLFDKMRGGGDGGSEELPDMQHSAATKRPPPQRQTSPDSRHPPVCTVHLRGQTDKVLTFKRT